MVAVVVVIVFISFKVALIFDLFGFYSRTLNENIFINISNAAHIATSLRKCFAIELHIYIYCDNESL